MEATKDAKGTGVELRALEVTVTRAEAMATAENEANESTDDTTVGCPECECEFTAVVPFSVIYGGYGDGLLEALRRKGIDLGRPFVLHIDDVAGWATARQEPWSGE